MRHPKGRAVTEVPIANYEFLILNYELFTAQGSRQRKTHRPSVHLV
jgi:hypothetical protein